MKNAAELAAERSSVRINVSNGNWGTGFYVGRLHIVTCAHVVPVAFEDNLIISTLHGQPFSGRVVKRVVIDADVEVPWPDVLLIKVDAAGLPLHVVEDPGRDALMGYGYRSRDDPGESFSCEFDGTRNLTPDPGYGDLGQPYLLKFKKSQFRAGFSGGPMIHDPTCKCRGMIKRSVDPSDERGGYAVPAQLLLGVLPEIREMQLALVEGLPDEMTALGARLTQVVVDSPPVEPVPPAAAMAVANPARLRELWKEGRTQSALAEARRLHEDRDAFASLDTAQKRDVLSTMAYLIAATSGDPKEVSQLLAEADHDDLS